MPYAPFDLTGRVALVTGGNGGIGLGMASALAAAGCDVAIWGTNESKNEAALAVLGDAGAGRARAYVCDVGSESEVESVFSATVRDFGRLDVCVANAGIGGGAPSFMELSLEEWRRVMRVNMEGAFLTLRAAARQMVSAGTGGSLIGIASLAAIEGAARNEHYAATKGGMVAMIRGLAVELARYRIRANAVLPGWIETGMTEGAFGNERFADKVLPRVPVRRWGQPEDFGGIGVYLASDAAAYHTGDTILIDGGYAAF